MQRFFSADSFWNTPLPAQPEIDPRNDHCIHLLEAHVPRGGFWINHDYPVPASATAPASGR